MRWDLILDGGVAQHPLENYDFWALAPFHARAEHDPASANAEV